MAAGLKNYTKTLLVKTISALLFLLLFCSYEAAAESFPKVLIINSYHYGYTFSDNETIGIWEVLKKSYPGIEPQIEYLDSKNFSDMRHFDLLKEMFLKKYSNMKFSVVITQDDPAFVFIKKYKDEIFPNTPVVFCGVNNFKDEMLKGYKGITGVSEGMDIAENINLMLEHFPETKEIFIVHDVTMSGIAIRNEAIEQIKSVKTHAKFTFSKECSIKEMLDTLAHLNKNTLALLLAFNRDKDGLFFNFDNFTQMVASVIKVPFYGTREEMLGYGIIGGKIIGGKSHSVFAADIAVDIINGKSVDSIPVFKGSTSKFMFDNNMLRKYSISKNSLPNGSVIINEKESFYSKYYIYIWAIICTFLLLVAIILIMLVNIIRRKKAERALKKLEQRMQMALQLTASSTFENNFKTGEAIISPAAFNKMGYSNEEIPKSLEDLTRFTHPDDLAVIQSATEKHIKGESPSYYAEFRMKAKNGDWVWHSGSGKIADYDHDGKPLRLIGLSQDINERKENQEKILKYAEELKATNASKDKFFSIIAHDLKSPFLGLLGFSNVLSKSLDELTHDEIKKYAGYINKATRNIYELIEQLLAWSRLQTGRIEFIPKSVNLKEICENTIGVLINNARSKNIELHNEIGDNCMITADENMLRSILHNLMSNAIKFSNKGGTVKVSTKESEGYLAISISDNGVGIKSKDMSKLFRLDEQISTKGTAGEEGTGLGLVLCKEMVAKHNGEIFAESEAGKGSTFTFKLPLVQDNPDSIQ